MIEAGMVSLFVTVMAWRMVHLAVVSIFQAHVHVITGMYICSVTINSGVVLMYIFGSAHSQFAPSPSAL